MKLQPARYELPFPSQAGKKLAAKTFNPRLGVEGGLSILGTSGIVRPFSGTALRDALKCALNVAEACGIKAPVLVPGRIGDKGGSAAFSSLARATDRSEQRVGIHAG